MSFWRRMANVFRGEKLNRDIDEELNAHLDEAIERGRDPEEVRQAFGSTLRHREQIRDASLVVWLDSLRADAIFGWRRLNKTRVTTAAAILSLALAIGACTSVFRLIDALLLRPLPIAHAERLYSLSREGIWDGKPETSDDWAYPDFQLMRAAGKDQSELIAASRAERTDVTFRTDDEMEKAHVQYVSGWMFSAFGLRPELGRLLAEDDDLTPGAHAFAVLSHDYWKRRFGQDSTVVGRTFRMNNNLFEIIGVAGKAFTGTEPGTMTDIFVPTMMNSSVTHRDSTWHRTFALVNPGVPLEPLRSKLDAISRTFETERSKSFTGMTQRAIEEGLNQSLILEPAGSGASDLQQGNRRALMALGVLVALVLLIACANVANLMTAQAAARAREMALRVSIGAGRWRLVQLVLIESVWVALLAAAIGGTLAWWSAPFVVSMINPPDNPARLVLPADWRIFGFGIALTLGVTCLFGSIPALRASSVKPVSALKGGEDPHSRRRIMHALIAVQVAFCFLVLFVSGLFVATFERISHQSVGFSSDRLLTLETFAQGGQPTTKWLEAADHLRELPGVEVSGLCMWPLLDGNSHNNFIARNGGPPVETLAYFLRVSPGWMDEMKIPMIEGRDFLPNEATPGAAIVNETFAKTYFNGENPVGKTFEETYDEGGRIPFRVVGLVRDARYRDIHEHQLPVAYTPFRSVDRNGKILAQKMATFIVRTDTGDPNALAQSLRQEIHRANPGFRVTQVRTQLEINQAQTVRERLLAALAVFAGFVALVLAGVGLYGVLHYSVLQRRREIGIRIAVGAQAKAIARLVTTDVVLAVLAGAVAGLVLGLVSVRFVESLFYQVKPTDPAMLAFPAVTILFAAFLAAIPAVIRAVRIDPVTMLRTE